MEALVVETTFQKRARLREEDMAARREKAARISAQLERVTDMLLGQVGREVLEDPTETAIRLELNRLRMTRQQFDDLVNTMKLMQEASSEEETPEEQEALWQDFLQENKARYGDTLIGIAFDRL